MSDERMTAEEFARLLALPESHPERRRAEASAEFIALRALHQSFVAGTDFAGGGEATGVRDELSRRVLAQVDRGSSPIRSARANGAASGLSAVLAAFLRPAPRRAFVFATVVLVAGIGGWAALEHRREADVLRGDSAAAFDLRVAPPREGTVVVAWNAVPGADGYRVVVLGPDLAEAAHIELGRATTWTLRPDSLPAGAAEGKALSIEVEALAGGGVLATTPARTIRLP